MKPLTLFLLCMLLAPLAHALPYVDTILPLGLSVLSGSNVQLTSFGVSPSTFVSGASITFSVGLQNTGNTVTDYQALVFIYNSSGSLVDAFAYQNSTIAGGEAHNLSRQYSTSSLQSGSYSATAKAVYGGIDSNQLTTSLYANFVRGNASSISASGVVLSMLKINNTNVTNGTITTGLLPVALYDNASALVLNFSYNFSSAALELEEINLSAGTQNITLGTNGSAAYMVVNGIDEDGLSGTKTLSTSNANPAYTMVCVKDSAPISISNMSANCTASGEFTLTCGGAAVNGVTCTLSGTLLTVYGLQHSAVRQYVQIPSTAPSGGTGIVGGGGGGGGGGSGGGPRGAAPSPTVPEVEVPSSLESTLFRVLRYPLFKEVVAGESALLYSLVENKGAGVLSLNAFPTTRGNFLAGNTSVHIAQNESGTVVMPINIPSGTKPGFYLLTTNFLAGGETLSYQQVIKVLPQPQEGVPAVAREALLDYAQKAMYITLSVLNTGSLPMPQVQVYEKMPQALASQPDRLSFGAQPAEVQAREGTMRWDFENLLPSQRKETTYIVNGLIPDLSIFSSWSIDEIVSIKPASQSDILLRDVWSSSMEPGGQGTLTLKLFNAGASERKVRVDILAPQGWTSIPSTFDILIPPRQTAQTSLAVKSPRDIEPGAYSLLLQLKYGNTIDEKSVALNIYRELVTIAPAPSLPHALASFALENAPQVLFAIIAIAIAAFALRAIIKHVRSPKFDQSRLDALRLLEKTLKGNA